MFEDKALENWPKRTTGDETSDGLLGAASIVCLDVSAAGSAPRTRLRL